MSSESLSSESFSPDAPRTTVRSQSKKAPDRRDSGSTQGTALLNEEEHEKTDAILMHELVTENSIVAVRPKKVGLYDYFVLEVTSEKVETLVKDEVDEFGTSFPKGSKVFRGNYFNFQREMKAGSMYQLNKEMLLFIRIQYILSTICF